MDRITKALLDEFSAEQGIQFLAEDSQFEHFAAYLAVSKSHEENFETLEYFFRNGTIDKKYRPAKYHLLMTTRLLANGMSLPKYNSHEMEKYCEALIQKLWNSRECGALYKVGAEKIEKIAKGDFDRDKIRTQLFTEDLKNEILCSS